MDSENSYFAHGKLMLLGEFFVLRGANCIAAPSIYGQSLKVVSDDRKETLKWEALIENKQWFSAEYDLKEFEVISASNNFLAESFARLARVVRELNSRFLENGAAVTTNLNFPQSWGLGSSSTIIKLLADWAGVDPFDIHFATSTGSGYDIASAIANKPIVYQSVNEEPKFYEIELPDVVKQSCYFIYLGKKQNSQRSVKLFLQRGQQDLPVERMNELASEFINSTSVKGICSIMSEHDRLLSPILDLKRVKEVMFKDFEGEVKSLGAWGGDFVMACTENDAEYVSRYFKNKGLDTVLTYKKLLL
jgi:mevalonate kinase